MARRGWAATAPARRLLGTASVRWHLHVVMGEAASQIVAQAEAPGATGINDINGIVIGSRGQSVIKALMLGSVAEKIVHSATVPVMIVL